MNVPFFRTFFLDTITIRLDKTVGTKAIVLSRTSSFFILKLHASNLALTEIVDFYCENRDYTQMFLSLKCRNYLSDTNITISNRLYSGTSLIDPNFYSTVLTARKTRFASKRNTTDVYKYRRPPIANRAD